MKVLKIIICVILSLFLLNALLPQTYNVERSIEIDTNLSRVFELSNDLDSWSLWSPWGALDNSVNVEIGDISKGIGASQKWSDNNGTGRLTFVESTKNERISYNIWFGDAKEPAISTMKFEQITDQKIKIYWTIKGNVQIPIIGFIFASLMDTLIGSAFELGLDDLKREAEA